MGKASLREVLLDHHFMAPDLDLRPWRKGTSRSGRVNHGNWSPKDWSRGCRRHRWIVGSHGAWAATSRRRRRLERKGSWSPHWGKNGDRVGARNAEFESRLRVQFDLKQCLAVRGFKLARIQCQPGGRVSRPSSPPRLIRFGRVLPRQMHLLHDFPLLSLSRGRPHFSIHRLPLSRTLDLMRSPIIPLLHCVLISCGARCGQSYLTTNQNWHKPLQPCLELSTPHNFLDKTLGAPIATTVECRHH